MSFGFKNCRCVWVTSADGSRNKEAWGSEPESLLLRFRVTEGLASFLVELGMLRDFHLSDRWAE